LSNEFLDSNFYLE